MTSLRTLSLTLAASGFAVACAPQGDFPSLAPRAVELQGSEAPRCARATAEASGCTVGGTPVPAAAAAPAVADAQLGARVTALLEQAQAGERAFARLLGQAQTSARRAGAAGSEGWIAAQIEISRLQAARSPAVDALAELDSLLVARSANRATAAEDRERLAAAAEEARRLLAAQQAELDRLEAALRRP